ncbi:MAG: aspartate carbamoyltransferase regulatory subunit [Ruminococcaceae bacterium]|nr:aspartate carbamoyltransferase regulatory subunit [Oscillospiraceae bacterium]
MNIDSIKNGFVIDHIAAGKGMKIYKLLGLSDLSCQVAMIMNAQSSKTGKKDVIKIDADIDLDTHILGYVDPGITVNVIKDSKIVEKKKIELPERLTNILYCKNPRCITSTEQELSHEFVLTDKQRRIYRCIYCDSEA